MSGHSKWSTIKHKKAKTDAQRGKLFSKIAKEIMVAAKLGGGDPEMNPRLRLILQKAKEANMPNDNVQRAITKGTGGGDDTNLSEITYEAYAQNGVAILIETLTDNVNRTVSNLRTVLNKNGGNMVEKGSVAYLFSTKGLFLFDESSNKELIMDLSIENNAEDVDIKDDNSIEITCELSHFEQLKNIYEKNNLIYTTATITKIPSNTIIVNEDIGNKIINLIENLENDDDVQEIHANFEISYNV